MRLEGLEGKRARVRALLAQGLEALARTPVDPAPLRQALLDLEGPFLLVVVGEFNSGKSSLVNALLGEDLLPEGPTPSSGPWPWWTPRAPTPFWSTTRS